MAAPRGAPVTVRAVLFLAVALGAAACAGGGGDKAGGGPEPVAQAPARPVGKPVTLTLVAVDSLWAEEFAAAVSRLSGGSIRIRTRFGGSAILDYERTLVGHVRAGRADLASVGARAWDRMGVRSFQGLVAPLVVDSLELEQRVLERPGARQALAGVEPLGLVGLAVLPGPLRRPFGLSRPLLGPDDYRGATVGIRLGRVADSTLRALGAAPKGYRIGALGRVDGAELDAATIQNNRYDVPGAAVTANVALWARPETIVISSTAFARLAPAQRAVLRRAGRAAVAPVRSRVEREQRRSARRAVRARVAEARHGVREGRGRVACRRASGCGGARARSRDATPDRRDRAPEARRSRPTSSAARASGAGAGALRGRWTAHGRVGMTLELGGGHWNARGQGGSWSGTYVVEGSRLRLVLERCLHNPCDPGAATVLRWSVYRDTLALTPVAGHAPWPTESSWRRAA